MPAPVPDVPPSAPLCKKCKARPGQFPLRDDICCRECYDRSIGQKCHKRLETLRIRPPGEAVPMLLLPISFGVSSTALLHFISAELRSQRQKVGRTAYRLVVLHVDETTIDASAPPPSALEAAKQRFPETGEYVHASLEDIYDFKSAAADEDLPDQIDDGGKSKSERLREFLNALPSATSRMDIAGILKSRLIVEIAKQRGCESILWGDSTTRLAEKTLSETAKGRGFSLPWSTAEGKAPYGVTNSYPLRDIFKKELVTYVSSVVSPPLLPLCVSYSAEPKHSIATATSGRNITVDQLMTQYFESMESQYPSIVSNVVKTAGRLEVADKEADSCRICGMPGDGGGGGLTLSALSLRNERMEGACYGCIRSLHGAEDYQWPLER